MPTTRSGWRDPAAIAVTESVDVLVWKSVSGRHTVVELAERRRLEPEVLEHRLDDDVAAREVAERRRPGQARERRVARLGLEPALLDAAVQEAPDLLEAARHAVVLEVAQHDAMAGAGDRHRDPRPHRARAEHAHLQRVRRGGRTGPC